MLIGWGSPVANEAAARIEDYFQRVAGRPSADGVYETGWHPYDLIFLYSLYQFLAAKYGLAHLVKFAETRPGVESCPVFFEDNLNDPRFAARFAETFGDACLYTVDGCVRLLGEFLDWERLDPGRKEDSLVVYCSQMESNLGLVSALMGADAATIRRENNIFEYLYYGAGRGKRSSDEDAYTILPRFLSGLGNVGGNLADAPAYGADFDYVYRWLDAGEARGLIYTLALQRDSRLEIISTEKAARGVEALMRFMAEDFLFFTNAKDLERPYDGMEEYAGYDQNGEVYWDHNVLCIGISSKYVIPIGATLFAGHE